MLDVAFKYVGIDEWAPFVKQDSRFIRPAEVDVLRGDYTKAKNKLGWQPTVHFSELVSKMVSNDIEQLSKFTNNRK